MRYLRYLFALAALALASSAYATHPPLQPFVDPYCPAVQQQFFQQQYYAPAVRVQAVHVQQFRANAVYGVQAVRANAIGGGGYSRSAVRVNVNAGGRQRLLGGGNRTVIRVRSR